MENLFEIIAILIFLVLSGLGSFSKKMREKQQKESQGDTTSKQATPKPLESPRPIPKPIKMQKQKPLFEKKKPKPASPPPEPDEPVWGRMLREILDIEQPEPVFEPPQPTEPETVNIHALKSKKKRTPPKPPKSRIQSTTPKTMPLRSPLSYSMPLNRIINRAKDEPFKSAIILSEILQSPRAKRKSIRT